MSRFIGTHPNLIFLHFSAEYWYFEDQDACSKTQPTTDCSFRFAFCKALPKEATPGVTRGEYGAVQVDTTTAGSFTVILGKVGHISQPKGGELASQHLRDPNVNFSVILLRTRASQCRYSA